MAEIRYQSHVDGVDWADLKKTLSDDQFDNGRTAEQLKRSFENSAAVVFALAEGEVIGTARALSDGVCNAYIVDVWTQSAYRRRGIGTEMMRRLLAELPGQHVGLFADEYVSFYERLGFVGQTTGFAQVVGTWLNRQA